MKHNKQNPNHNPHHQSMMLRLRWEARKRKYRMPGGDNYARAYSDESEPLEARLRTAIAKQRDKWRMPFTVTEKGDGTLQKDYEPYLTIREKLNMPDAAFRYSAWKYHFSNWCTWVRVPSLKRSNTEWENFYRTFPSIAVKVALGDERFCDGAKLKYIPLFRRILDEVWPENLERWTETQFENLLKGGRIPKNL